MRIRLAPYIQSVKITLLEGSEYRLNYILSFLCVAIPLLGILFLWTTVYDGRDEFMGFTLTQTVTYYLLARWLADFLEPGQIWDVTNDIYSGSLANHLLRPVDYFWYNFSVFAGSKLYYSAVAFGITCLIALFFRKTIFFQSDPLILTLSGITIVLAVILGYLISFLISVSAFWFERATGMDMTSNFLIPLLSGSLIPLNFFPGQIGTLFQYLPFHLLISFPIRLYLGFYTIEGALVQLSIMLFWIGIFYFIARSAFSRGLNLFTAVGK